MFFHLVSLYALVRIARSRVVVETGGTPGKSSAFILRALERNGTGDLYTVDLPPVETDQALIEARQSHDMLPGRVGAAWCVPAHLRGGHHLLLGPAQEFLPSLLERLGEVDIFIHDSDHSYSHMLWEFRTALPFVRQGGYIWSDDILGNSAWPDFCAEAHLERGDFLSQGAAQRA